MTIYKWTNIEECPQNINFVAILKYKWRIKICLVYVHIDNHFLVWKDLRTLDNISIGKWKCIYYIK